MDVSWTTRANGWEGTLLKLNKDRNDLSLPRQQRQAANKAHVKIINQLNDKKLMGLRERLIKASRAKDELWVHRITQQMRDYNGEDRETGLYGDD